MPPEISSEKRHKIKALLQLNICQEVVADRLQVSRSTVQRVQSALTHYGTSKRPQTIPRGRPPTISDDIAMVLLYCFVFAYMK